jgi:TatD DNase family protein
VAIGETGLDWFKEFSPREEQLESFAWHLDLAAELDKPVIVHCRDAHEATAELVTSHPLRRGVMHFYAYGPDELQPYLDAGYFVSFSGVVTYPRNEANREAAKQVPLDRLLVETDSPFLAPQGHRGKRNEPALVVPILERVAELRGMTPVELAEVTSANAARLFGLPDART